MQRRFMVAELGQLALDELQRADICTIVQWISEKTPV